MNIFIYTDFPPAARQYLRNNIPAGHTTSFRTELDKQNQETAFQAADIVLGNPPADWFRQIPAKLVFWQIASAGFDQFKNLRLSIPVANMGDFYARPCAETIVGGIVAFYRGIHQLAKLQTQKQWKGLAIRENIQLLGDQQAIILGAGAIGKHVKNMLQGFGCMVRMNARTNPEAELHGFDELVEALPQTTLLINTLPGSAKNYVTAKVFDALPAGSVYASVGRGDTTDETALIKALQSGRLAGAALDVTEKEPLPADSPLWTMENVILTQHTGGGKRKEFEGIADQFLTNLQLFMSGKPLKDTVELARGY